MPALKSATALRYPGASNLWNLGMPDPTTNRFGLAGAGGVDAAPPPTPAAIRSTRQRMLDARPPAAAPVAGPTVRSTRQQMADARTAGPGPAPSPSPIPALAAGQSPGRSTRQRMLDAKGITPAPAAPLPRSTRQLQADARDPIPGVPSAKTGPPVPIPGGPPSRLDRALASQAPLSVRIPGAGPVSEPGPTGPAGPKTPSGPVGLGSIARPDFNSVLSGLAGRGAGGGGGPAGPSPGPGASVRPAPAGLSARLNNSFRAAPPAPAPAAVRPTPAPAAVAPAPPPAPGPARVPVAPPPAVAPVAAPAISALAAAPAAAPAARKGLHFDPRHGGQTLLDLHNRAAVPARAAWPVDQSNLGRPNRLRTP